MSLISFGNMVSGTRKVYSTETSAISRHSKGKIILRFTNALKI